jgi:MULE transposase domain
MTLLRYEDAQKFYRLFQKWIEAIYNKHPRAIITDQDPVMKKAVELTFSNIVHRCCQ